MTALGEVKTAEHKAEEATIAVGTAIAAAGKIGDKALSGYLSSLDDIAHALDPTGAIAKGLDALIAKSALLAQQKASGITTDADAARLAQEFTALQSGQRVHVSRADAAMLKQLGLPDALLHFALGGFVPGPLGAPRLAVVHGGEKVETPTQQRTQDAPITVTQENHFHGGSPDPTDLEFNNRELAWAIARKGRRA